jgi:hypothetical protein
MTYKPRPSTQEILEAIKAEKFSISMSDTQFGRGLKNIKNDACFARIYNFTSQKLKTMHYIIRRANREIFDYHSIIKDMNRISSKIAVVRVFDTSNENVLVVEFREPLKSKYPDSFLEIYYITIMVILRCCDKEYAKYYTEIYSFNKDDYDVKFPIKTVESLIKIHYDVTGGKVGHGVSEHISGAFYNKNMYSLAIKHHINIINSLFSRKSKFPKEEIINLVEKFREEYVENRRKEYSWHTGKYIAQTPSWNILESTFRELSKNE